jgi:hypothetical protein
VHVADIVLDMQEGAVLRAHPVNGHRDPLWPMETYLYHASEPAWSERPPVGG